MKSAKRNQNISSHFRFFQALNKFWFLALQVERRKESFKKWNNLLCINPVERKQTALNLGESALKRTIHFRKNTKSTRWRKQFLKILNSMPCEVMGTKKLHWNWFPSWSFVQTFTIYKTRFIHNNCWPRSVTCIKNGKCWSVNKQ